jgi:hypothetical protein
VDGWQEVQFLRGVPNFNMEVYMNYKQCSLKRRTSKGYAYTTSWLPIKFAILGKILKLKDIDGWKVISVNDEERTQEQVNMLSREYLKHRNITDI